MRSLFIAAGLFFAACGHSHDDYATFQACYDEHTTVESLPFQEALIVCCLDHFEGEPCGATAPECVTYMAANLTSTATTTEVEAACDEYVIQKGM
jgi:hypothetical protein